MFLDGLEDAIFEAVARYPKILELPEDKLSDLMREVIENSKNAIVPELIDTLKSETPRVLKTQRREEEGFRRRNMQRWSKSFNALEAIILFCIEVAEDWDFDIRQAAHIEGDFKFEALSHLCPRGILVAQESLCLMKGGFADGSLARWRSLHEILVTAMFIEKHDQATAMRFLGSFAFASRRAAKQYNEYAERAGLAPFVESELDDIDKLCAGVERQLGRAIKNDYDWAREALNFESSRRITLFDIESDVDMDHWRPRYRWATQHTHAPHRPPEKLLGMVEAKSSAHLVGPSNSGFVDPLEMVAISLTELVATCLLHTPSIEKIILAEVSRGLADGIGRVASEEESLSLNAVRKSEEG